MVITSYEVAYSIYEDVNNMRSIRLNSNTTSFVIQDLKPDVPYQVRVTAFSHEEMGLQNDFVVFFSKELSPLKPPDDIKFVRLNTTSISVTWTPLSLFEAQGFPIYKVTLSPTTAESQSKRQSNSSVLITENNFAVFTDLKANQEYSLTVGVATEASSDYISSKSMKVSVHMDNPGNDSKKDDGSGNDSEKDDGSGNDSKKDDGSGSSNILAIIQGIIAGVAIIVIIAMCCVIATYCCLRNKKKNMYYRVISEPETIGDEDQDVHYGSDHTETQEEVQKISCVHPTSNISVNSEGNVASTVTTEFEMQNVQQ